MRIPGRLAVGLIVTLVACAPDQEFGQFNGPVKTEWDEEGRTMRLMEDFSYTDPQGVRWDAPAGSVINGASIPRPLWTAAGSPFTGQYRKASVVHDVACDEKTRPWKDVHRMFYYACRAGGVGERQGKVMFAAVYHFGPRWGDEASLSKREVSVKDFAALKKMIVTSDLPLAAIEAYRPK